MSSGPFKLDKNGHIIGPVALPSVPGMPPGTVLVNVDLLNRLYQLGRESVHAERIAQKQRERDRIRSVIADLELDHEPLPDFIKQRK